VATGTTEAVSYVVTWATQHLILGITPGVDGDVPAQWHAVAVRAGVPDARTVCGAAYPPARTDMLRTFDETNFVSQCPDCRLRPKPVAIAEVFESSSKRAPNCSPSWVFISSSIAGSVPASGPSRPSVVTWIRCVASTTALSALNVAESVLHGSVRLARGAHKSWEEIGELFSDDELAALQLAEDLQ
jgi:hypothetical protein